MRVHAQLPGSGDVAHGLFDRRPSAGRRVPDHEPSSTADGDPAHPAVLGSVHGRLNDELEPPSATSAFSGNDILARGATNFAEIALLDRLPPADIVGVVRSP